MMSTATSTMMACVKVLPAARNHSGQFDELFRKIEDLVSGSEERVMSKWLVFMILGIAVSYSAQERFQSGEFKGFTKSPTEHIISRVDEPVTVSSVHGTVVFKGKDDALKQVIVEIRGPGT